MHQQEYRTALSGVKLVVILPLPSTYYTSSLGVDGITFCLFISGSTYSPCKQSLFVVHAANPAPLQTEFARNVNPFTTVVETVVGALKRSNTKSRAAKALFRCKGKQTLLPRISCLLGLHCARYAIKYLKTMLRYASVAKHCFEESRRCLRLSSRCASLSGRRCCAQLETATG
jgi:hypothetical protein